MATTIQRYYRKSIPEVNSIVIATISNISDDVVNCTLPAYGNMEALLPFSEMPIKRGKKAKDYVRDGQNIPVQIMRIVNNSVDVSMKQVRATEGKLAMEQYSRDSKVALIVRSACEQDSERIRTMYDDCIWNLISDEQDDDETIKICDGVGDSEVCYNDVYNIFETIRSEQSDTNIYGITDVALLRAINIHINLRSYSATIVASIRFGIYPDGCKRLQEELMRLTELGLTVIITSPPSYKLSVTDTSMRKAKNRLDEIVKTIPTPS